MKIKKNNILSRKKKLSNITQISIGSGSAIGSSTMSIINPSIAVVLTYSTAFLTSTAILITNEYISKIKSTYTKLRHWINVIFLLYDETLKQSMIDKKFDERSLRIEKDL